jgi:hypothetical protein
MKKKHKLAMNFRDIIVVLFGSMVKLLDGNAMMYFFSLRFPTNS